jgi:hypothetical protein
VVWGWPAVFFLFSKLQEELADLYLAQESLKNSWGVVVKGIGEFDFAAAFRRWSE